MTDNTKDQEDQLAKDLINPDTRRQAFSKMVSLYQEQLYWQIRKLVISHDDAADILQNTFIKIWQNLDCFRGDSKLSTWMYTIAHNEALSFLSKMQSERELTLDDPDGNLQNQIEGDTYFDGDEAQRLLLQAVATLPARQRQVFNMRYYDEISYEEISQILGTSVGALKASYHFAVDRIAQIFKKYERD